MTTTGILLLTTLVQLLLFHIPASSVRSARIICRADSYDWMEVNHKNDTISPSPQSTHEPGILLRALNVASDPIQDKFGPQYLAKFYSKDGNIQLTTVTPNGTMSFTNHGNIVGKVELLMTTYRPRPLTPAVNTSTNSTKTDTAQHSTGFQYNTVWPGTMQSSSLEKSPDLREATVVVDVEKKQLIYLGTVPGDKPLYGKVVEDVCGNYKLIYRDVHLIEKQTDKFQVLVLESCVDMLKIDANNYCGVENMSCNST